MQLSVTIDFISNSPICAKTSGTWKSVCMAVEFLFLEGEQPIFLGNRLLRQRSGEINYDLGIAWINYVGIFQKLHLVAPKLKVISGRYRDNAVPI